MKPIAIFCFMLCFLASANAWTRPMGIKIYRVNGKEPTVSVFSEIEKENVRRASVDEAVKILASAKQDGARIAVGIVVEAGVRVEQYFPILKAISENYVMHLDFVEGRLADGKVYSSSLIRNMIEKDVLFEHTTK